MSAPTGPTGPAVPAVRPRRVLTTVLVVLALATTGVVAVGALAYCSVFGCTFFSEDFEPDGEDASAARATATAEASALADRISLGYEVLADATADGCTTGQNNWKRKDTYSHDCSVLQGRVLVATDDLAAVADGLTAMDAGLRDLGCRPQTPRSGLDRVRDEYWDEDNPQVAQHGAAGLPSAVYSCPDDRTVQVQPTSAGVPTADASVAFGPVFLDEPLREDWFTSADVTALRASGAQLALAVRVEQPYYRTRF
jgi:hypothetical protein